MPAPELMYQMYLAQGGQLSFDDWQTMGMPGSPPEEDAPIITPPPGPPIVPPALPPPTPLEPPSEVGGESKPTGEEQDGTLSPGGEWIFSERVNDWIPHTTPTPVEPPPPGEPPVGGEEDFSGQLAAAVAAWQEEQRRVGELQQAEVGRRGARDIGKMSTEQRNALLSRGYTPAEIEQLTAGGVEAGFRSIYDIQKEMGLSLQQQLAQSEQWGIGTMITGEQLEQRQREMAMAGGQFQQSLAEQVRQFNLAQAQQAGQFGQQFGLSQEQLAQQESQFGRQLTLAELQAKYGFYGDIAQGAGSFLGSLFSRGR